MREKKRFIEIHVHAQIEKEGEERFYLYLNTEG